MLTQVTGYSSLPLFPFLRFPPFPLIPQTKPCSQNHGSLSPPRGIICMVHGYRNDISWTFQATPIFLAQNGFVCFAMDLPGYEKSYGSKLLYQILKKPLMHALLSSILILQSPKHKNLPSFLYGESLDGAICLLITLKYPNLFKGIILIAPMCKIFDKVKPKWPIPEILTLLVNLCPIYPLFQPLIYSRNQSKFLRGKQLL